MIYSSSAVSYRHRAGKITSRRNGFPGRRPITAFMAPSLSASVCSSVKAGSPLALAEMEAYSRKGEVAAAISCSPGPMHLERIIHRSSVS